MSVELGGYCYTDTQLFGLHSLYYYVGYHSVKVVINLAALCTLLWAPSWEAIAYKALCM
jgi:hypothetical protein